MVLAQLIAAPLVFDGARRLARRRGGVALCGLFR
jgi:hypothetical protein